MANTDILGALRQVRSLEKQIGKQIVDGGLSADETNLLQECRDDLIDLEDKLVLEDVREGIAALERDAKDLQTLSNEMKQASASLKQVAVAVADVAKVVGTLADVLSKASAAGLL